MANRLCGGYQGPFPAHGHRGLLVRASRAQRECQRSPRHFSTWSSRTPHRGVPATSRSRTDRRSCAGRPTWSTPDPVFVGGWNGGLRSAIADHDAMNHRAGRARGERRVRATGGRAGRDPLRPGSDRSTPTDPSPRQTTVSVTGLVTYAQCPKRFYWSAVDLLPRRRSPSAVAGTELHRRIELHQRGQVPFEQLSDDLYDVPDEMAGDGGFNAFRNSRFSEQPGRHGRGAVRDPGRRRLPGSRAESTRSTSTIATGRSSTSRAGGPSDRPIPNRAAPVLRHRRHRRRLRVSQPRGARCHLRLSGWRAVEQSYQSRLRMGGHARAEIGQVTHRRDRRRGLHPRPRGSGATLATSSGSAVRERPGSSE